MGLVVAEAQDKLDDTLVETAKELSETQIDVIAVFEQEIDNDGQMTQGKPHPMKLSLVNYIMPTAYKCSRVYLQADMNVKEFNSTNGLNIQGSARVAQTLYRPEGTAPEGHGGLALGHHELRKPA